MTARDRSTLLRMAGNIGGGIASRRFVEPGDVQAQQQISDDAVSIALRIMADPRLVVTEPTA